MNAFALPLIAMLLCVVAELLIRKYRRGESIPWREVVFNLGSGHILMWFFRGLEIAAFGLVLRVANLHWVDAWPLAWQWAFGFVAWDFCFYWMHRLHHKIPLLWAVHVVHHQGEHFNLSLGIRNSWYSSLTNLPFVIGLAVAGLPLEIFVVVSSIHYAVQFYNHNGLVGSSGILDRFLVTPAHHRVHHGTAPCYLDRNFGGTFLWWDKLFGTFQPRLADVPLDYGVPGTPRSDNPLLASNLPLLRLVGGTCKHRAPRPGFHVPDLLIGLGGLLLFGIVIHYIHRDGAWQGQRQALLFGLIFAATIALGAMSDGRRWGAAAWVLLAGALALAGPLPEPAPDWPGACLYLGLLLHGVATLPRLLPRTLSR
ncbi:sterol desaturase family protein [Cupriavidus basilensis]|uniref:sterol desaturase family protein n=1 Tax=Cupriavidus basilensis TaxID=68895 RepID=UPI0039F64DCA